MPKWPCCPARLIHVCVLAILILGLFWANKWLIDEERSSLKEGRSGERKQSATACSGRDSCHIGPRANVDSHVRIQCVVSRHRTARSQCLINGASHGAEALNRLNAYGRTVAYGNFSPDKIRPYMKTVGPYYGLQATRQNCIENNCINYILLSGAFMTA